MTDIIAEIATITTEPDKASRLFIQKEYLQNPDSDSNLYSADDMMNAFEAGYAFGSRLEHDL